VKLPNKMRIRILADGRPLAGMFVRVDLKAKWRSDFSLGFGPSDEQGVLVITYEDLIRQARELCDFFIMDYGDPEKDLAGEIVVAAKNREALLRATEAYDSFQHVVQFPPRYAEQIQEARMLLDELRPKRLSVEIEHDGEGIVVRGETVVA